MRTVCWSRQKQIRANFETIFGSRYEEQGKRSSIAIINAVEEAAKEELLTIVVQVMGKVRSRLQVPADTSDDILVEMALADENTLKFIGGKEIKKTIVVKKKLVNIVIWYYYCQRYNIMFQMI